MARIRTIKPEFWTDEDMSEVSEPACLLAIGLLNYADDEGYFNANPKLIKAAVFPIREPSVPITVLLRELSNCGYLSMFSTSDGKHFGLIRNFLRHQVVNKPKESKIKVLELVPYEYGSDTGQVPLGKDQGSGIREINPPSIGQFNFSPTPDPGANNAVLDNRPPGDGGVAPLGKFPMHHGWMPERDFIRRAALWGTNLDHDVTPQELASFVTYWQAEGKAFHQAQWEQKLAKSIGYERSKNSGRSRANNQPLDWNNDDWIAPISDQIFNGENQP